MENKALIQSLYDAFARGDADTVLGALHPNVDWREAEGNPYADGNPYDSPQRVGEGVFGRILSEYEEFAATPQRLVAEGDMVVALGRYTGRKADTDDTLDAPFVHAWTVEDGRVTAFQQYTDTRQWAELSGSG